MSGKRILANWMDKVRDRSTRVAIDRRLNRIENGNFGDHRFCRDGIWELRIDTGPGYRVYYAISGDTSCCCCAAATRAPKAPILLPVRIGEIGREGTHYERHIA
jgi:putative addiction module killer protein